MDLWGLPMRKQLMGVLVGAVGAFAVAEPIPLRSGESEGVRHELHVRRSEKPSTGRRAAGGIRTDLQAAGGTHTPSQVAAGTRFKVAATPALLEELRVGRGAVRMRIPVAESETLDLDLERFEVGGAATRFVVVSDGGQVESRGPQVTLLRGKVAGSSVFLALADDRLVMGRIDSPGVHALDISHADGAVAAGADQVWTVQKADTPGATPDLVPPCGVTEGHRRTLAAGPVTAGVTVTHGPQIAVLAIEGDQSFTQLFPDVATAQAYVVALVGAVSDIYERDLDVKLVLGSVRLWPGGGEPFSAANLGGFRDYWLANENTAGINLVHLLSGRRNLAYGGIAYVGGFCGEPAFGISGFLLGGFPSPVDDPDLGNWDVIIPAHEMGHNLGTFHTHDGYTPPIDECGSANLWAQGEIMSYCHTLMGGTLNIDMRFSSRVQDVIADEVAVEGCLVFDCNANNIDDAQDILAATSLDANGNNVPDECEDCNANSVLDSTDISLGAADADGNGVPDSCEVNCNGNALPDEYETAFGFAPDANGNRVPDGCEPDCDEDLTPDFAEIAAAGSSSDIDRDGVPDACEDCNGNGQPDWADLGRPGFVYVADQGSDTVRVYHARSGVLETTLGGGLLDDPYDLAFGEDRMLYVSSFANDSVMRIDPDTGAASVLVASGGGGLDGPSGVLPYLGNLIVASSLSDRLLQFDGDTGAFLGVLPNSVSPDLVGPKDLSYSDDWGVLVATANNSVLAYVGFPGTPYWTVIASGAGGLTGVAQVAGTPNYNLLATSRLSNQVLEYDSNGGFLQVFNDEYPLTTPTGVAMNQDWNVLVARAGVQPIRIIEYDAASGRYLRSFIRGDFGLTAPTSIAVRWPPASEYPLYDCNGNGRPDECDVASGESRDVDGNGFPDECQSPWLNIDFSNGVGTRSFKMTYIGAASIGAIRVRMVDLQSPSPGNAPCCPPPDFSAFESVSCTAFGESSGCDRWVGPLGFFLESQDSIFLGTFRASRLQCTPYYYGWTIEPYITIIGPEILPSSYYEIVVYGEACQGSEDVCTQVSPAVQVFTRRSGDVVSPFSPASPTAQPDGNDVVAVLNKFKRLPGAPSKVFSQMQPNVIDLNMDVSGLDISAVVDAFKGLAYPFSGPCVCPSTVTCEATACASDAACGGGLCIRTCGGGFNSGQPCRTDAHCPSSTCGAGFCRDRCGRCRD